MHRRFLFAPTILLLLSCASTTAPIAFQSDRIQVVTRGSGPDIILIPGLTAQAEETWQNVAEVLDDRYRLHIVQVKGFAGIPAEANAEGPVAAPVASEIARYVRTAGLQRPAVIGHSMGGRIGMILAGRHPQSVGRLMIVDTMPFVGELFGDAANAPGGLRAIADQTREQVLREPLASGFMSQIFTGMTLRTEREETLMRHLRESDRRTVANAFHELIADDLRPELGRISVPVTVLYVQPVNTPTPITPAQMDAAMVRVYANAAGARLIRIEESRHFIHWDQPSRFIAEVDAFMDGGVANR